LGEITERRLIIKKIIVTSNGEKKTGFGCGVAGKITENLRDEKITRSVQLITEWAAQRVSATQRGMKLDRSFHGN
jgi:hypothetical protein